MLAVLMAGALHVALPPPLPDPPHGVPAPASTWSEDPPSSRFSRLLRNSSRRFLLPTLEVGVCNLPYLFVSLGFATFDATVGKRHTPLNEARDAILEFNNWHEPSFRNWALNMTSLPVFPDRDAMGYNYLMHPWLGATIHMLYRNHGVSWWQSIAIVVMWAILWEYLVEAAAERPALNDVLANTGGAMLGEALFRTKMLIKAQMAPGIPRSVLMAIIDPFGTLEDIVLDVAADHLHLGPVVNYLR